MPLVVVVMDDCSFFGYHLIVLYSIHGVPLKIIHFVNSNSLVL